MRSDRIIIGIVVTAFLAAYTAIVFSFFSAQGESQLVFLALLGVPLALVVIMFPQAALIVLAALIYSIDWLSEYWTLIPREATWLIDILIIILIARTILFLPIRQQRMERIEKLVYVLFGFAILSAILNGSSQTTLLVGLRVGFRYVLLFLVALHLNVSRQWLRGYVFYLFFIGLIQTPIVFIQYNYLGWADADRLSGTFGRNQTPGVAIFLLTLFIYMSAKMIEEQRVRLSYVLVILYMSVSPVLGEAKFYFLFLPLLIAFLIRSELFKRPLVSVGLLFFGILMIYGVDYVVVATGGWREGRNPLTYVTKLHEVFQQETQEPTTERYERSYKFIYALKLAAESPRTIFLGNGAGSITHSYVSQAHSSKAGYYSRWGLSSSAATIPWMLIEYGYLGTALFMLLLWMIFRRGRSLRDSHDIELRIYGRMLEAMTFTYGAWLFYANAWQSDQMNFIYWPLAAMLVFWSYRDEADREQEAANKRMQELKAAPVRAPQLSSY